MKQSMGTLKTNKKIKAPSSIQSITLRDQSIALTYENYGGYESMITGVSNAIIYNNKKSC